MAWCTVCNENREIDHRVRGDSRAVPTVSERYNRGGEYIGYEEGEAYKTTIESIPVCRWCGTRFEFPRAQSKEQYFNAKKQLVVQRWRAKRPNHYSREFDLLIAGGIVIGAAIGGITYAISRNAVAATGVAVVSVIGGAFLTAEIMDRIEKARGKTTSPEMQAWQTRLSELESLPYTEANYTWLTKQ